MKYLTINMWQSDNVETDYEVSDDIYEKIMTAFLSYCDENDYEKDESMNDPDTWEAFFDEVPLEDMDPDFQAEVMDYVRDEVHRSFMENWDDEGDIEEAFENCRWGFFPVMLKDY